jgi:hypothetical protein
MITVNLIEGPTPDAPNRPRQNAGLFDDTNLEELREARERQSWNRLLLEGRGPTAEAKRWARCLLGGDHAV